MHERMIVSLVLGAIVLLILSLAVFTDLGLPPEARDARDAREAPGARGQPSPPGAPAPAGDRGKRVKGVLLRVPPPARR